jgi:hypothetical protein
MSTSTHRRAAIAAAAVANVEAHEARIAAVEAAAQQAAETARAAIAAAEATTVATAFLREDDANDRDGARPRGPHKNRNVSPSPV